MLPQQRAEATCRVSARNDFASKHARKCDAGLSSKERDEPRRARSINEKREVNCARSANAKRDVNQRRQVTLTMKTGKQKALGSVPNMPNGEIRRSQRASRTLG